MMTYKMQLIGKLQNEKLQVTFTKKDGEKRVMNCTLMEGVVPKVEKKEGATERKVNPEVVAVWDLDKSAWRSFNVTSITNVQSI